MKRPKRSRKPTTLGVIVAIIIAVIAALQSAQKTNAPAPTAATSVTAAPGLTAINNAPVASTVTALPTQPPPTDLPGLEITPMTSALYEVTGAVGALGCPDTRCKVISEYKNGSIVVVTGSVMGTTYKTKKTRVWYQVISHDGSRVYIHGAYVKPHEGERRIERNSVACIIPALR